MTSFKLKCPINFPVTYYCSIYHCSRFFDINKKILGNSKYYSSGLTTKILVRFILLLVHFSIRLELGLMKRFLNCYYFLPFHIHLLPPSNAPQGHFSRMTITNSWAMLNSSEFHILRLFYIVKTSHIFSKLK